MSLAKPDRYFWINEDKDLKPIKVDVFKVIEKNYLFWNPSHEGDIPILNPDFTKIRNSTKPLKEQYYTREPYPEKLTKLEKQYSGDPRRIWEFLTKNQKEYKNEVKFIKKQWYHRLYGEWIWIGGKPTWISPYHWMFLNWWKGDYQSIDRKTGKRVSRMYPDYRDRDRRKFIFLTYAYTCTETFEKTDDYGMAIPEKDGSYKMVDLGYRICFGVNYPKHRRDGATQNCLSMLYQVGSQIEEGYSSIIANTPNTQKKHFDTKLVPAWRKMPFYFKPTHDGTDRPKRAINFINPANKQKDGELNFVMDGELNSVIDFSEMVDRAYYDHAKITGILLSDEMGKCFCKDVKIRMFDGSVKLVQDIQVGDVLMGDDGLPRNVLSLARGREQCYNIIPKKGEPWGCNESHILSVSVSDKFRKHKLGELIEITVKEYLSLSPGQKKSLTLYRVPVEYPEVEVYNPYIIGLWLGDGTAKSPQITFNNANIESIQAFKEYAESIGCNINGIFNTANSTVYSISNTGGINHFTKKLRELNLWGNKHIPKDYIINSRKNRLELLAGLLDSDGNRVYGGRNGYEITQKSKQIAEAIKEIALSLGFYASISEKIGKISSLNFTGIYYRVHIFGLNLEEIPCKVERKKHYKTEKHKNTRDPRKFGFKVEPRGEDDYYGFTIDGNRRFLLYDYTVAHNTTSVDVYEGWNIIKPTMSQGGESTINPYAFALDPSTVEEMEEGGGYNFKLICDASDFYQRKKNGQTQSGLFNMFIPAWDGLENFIGPYGESIIDDPTPEQAKFIGRNYGAKEYIKQTKAQLLAENSPKSLKALAQFSRMHPETWADCWKMQGGDLGFNQEKLDARMEELNRLMAERKDPRKRGNFVWVVGQEKLSASQYRERKHHLRFDPSHYVDFVEDENGRFFLTKRLGRNLASRRVWNAEMEFWMPEGEEPFIGCADPVGYHNKMQSKMREDKSKTSYAACGVFYDFDERIDGDKPVDEWVSNRFVCSYMHKTQDLDEYCEESKMMCIYFNALMFPEGNRDGVIKYFEETGYGGYLKYAWEVERGEYRDKPGFDTGSGIGVKSNLFSCIRDYIEMHVHKEEHYEIIEQWKRIKAIEEMTKFDLFTVSAGCLLGQRYSYRESPDFVEKIDKDDFDISRWMGHKH